MTLSAEVQTVFQQQRRQPTLIQSFLSLTVLFKQFSRIKVPNVLADLWTLNKSIGAWNGNKVGHAEPQYVTLVAKLKRQPSPSLNLTLHLLKCLFKPLAACHFV